MNILKFSRRKKEPTRPKALRPCSRINLLKDAVEAAAWKRVVHFLLSADDAEIAHVAEKMHAAFTNPMERDIVRNNIRQVMEGF